MQTNARQRHLVPLCASADHQIKRIRYHDADGWRWTHKSSGAGGLEGSIQAQTSPPACTESSAGLARSFLGQSFQLSFNRICRVSNVPHRFRKPFLRYIEFVGPILNFMGLEQADSASILRNPVSEIIGHTFSPLEATRWRVGQFPAPQPSYRARPLASAFAPKATVSHRNATRRRAL